MKTGTIRGKVLRYNLTALLVFAVLTAVAFNITVRGYVVRDVEEQLKRIGNRTAEMVLGQRPGILPIPEGLRPPLPPGATAPEDFVLFYQGLQHMLRDPLTLIHANYLLLGTDQEPIVLDAEDYAVLPEEIVEAVQGRIAMDPTGTAEQTVRVTADRSGYLAVILPVFQQNEYGLGWVVVCAPLDRFDQLLWGINGILLGILGLGAAVTAFGANQVFRRVTEPLAELTAVAQGIEARNFASRARTTAEDELQELVQSINRMAESLEHHDRAQKTFLQNVSHELRTPLMSIQSYAEGIRYGVCEQETGVEVILQEAGRLKHMVEDLLYLSRLEALDAELPMGPLVLRELLEECGRRFAAIALGKGKQLRMPAVPAEVMMVGDRDALTRSLGNLLDNALRHADSTVEVHWGGNPDWLELRVCNDGPGIPTELMPHIFDRFAKGPGGQHGLGLAIARSLVEKHGGTLRAENTAAGPCFVMRLPCSGKG